MIIWSFTAIFCFQKSTLYKWIKAKEWLSCSSTSFFSVHSSSWLNLSVHPFFFIIWGMLFCSCQHPHLPIPTSSPRWSLKLSVKAALFFAQHIQQAAFSDFSTSQSHLISILHYSCLFPYVMDKSFFFSCRTTAKVQVEM